MPARQIGGKYSLERQVGAGGMGAIWVARDQRLQRQVALKLMRSDHATSAGLRTRFEREAMAIAQIKNPHVVQVYDFGIEDDSPYMAMAPPGGEALAPPLQRIDRIALPALAALMVQAAKGLETAHAAGI